MSKKKIARPTSDYLNSIKKYTPFVPRLRKYKRRKNLSPSEKGYVTRVEKAMRFAQDLIPLTEQQAKKIKGHLYQPFYIRKRKNKETGAIEEHKIYLKGVRAIQLKGVNEHTKIKLKKVKVPILEHIEDEEHEGQYELEDTGETREEYTIITSNGRDFIYIPAENGSLENIVAVATKAFKDLKPIAIYLWAHYGRAGRAFKSIRQFEIWLYEEYSKYSAETALWGGTDAWVEGIAALVRE